METTWRWVLVAAIAPIAWGTTYYVTRHHLPDGYPLHGAAIRALPAGLLLLAACRRLPRGEWWWKSVMLGVLNMSAFFVLVYLAAQLLPTSVASVIMATSSITMMLMAWAMVAERPGALPLIGAALGIGGVSAMLLGGTQQASTTGVLASAAAMVMSSFGYVLAKRWSGQAPALASTSWQLLAGGAVLLPVAFAVEGAPPPVDVTSAAAFAYISVIGTAIAFAAWFGALQRLSAGTVGLVGLLNPVTGVAMGTMLAGESLSGRQLGGIAMVVTGIALGLPAVRRWLGSTMSARVARRHAGEPSPALCAQGTGVGAE